MRVLVLSLLFVAGCAHRQQIDDAVCGVVCHAAMPHSIPFQLGPGRCRCWQPRDPALELMQATYSPPDCKHIRAVDGRLACVD